MSRLALLSAVLVAVTVSITASSAVAKLPLGTAFEACGESGCRTTAGEEVLEVSIRLLEPTNEHGDAGAPAGAAPWIRVEIGFPDRGEPGAPPWLRSIERGFPVIFVPGAESLGVPRRGSRAYRWVPMRPAAEQAYARVTAGIEPFPAQVLAELDPAAVARADTAGVSGSAGTPEGDDEAAVPLLVVVLGAIGLLLASGFAYRARRLRRIEA